jgi:hypothetical protein
MKSKYVTVFNHRGFEICTMSPALPGQFGYIVDDIAFADLEFTHIQAAIDEIDKRLS